jgi:hypothetical protein
VKVQQWFCNNQALHTVKRASDYDERLAGFGIVLIANATKTLSLHQYFATVKLYIRVVSDTSD